MKKGNFKSIKNIILIIIFILLLVIFFFILSNNKNNKLINDIKEFVSSGEKVIYISNKKNYSKYPIKLLNKYDIDYLYVDSTKLSKFEKLKIQDIINNKYLSDIIIIFNNGKVVDAIIEYEDEESLNKFLQTNNLIPEVIGDNSKILKEVEEILNTDFSIIYIPYKNLEENKNQDKILQEISEAYEINYKKIEAYLLSKKQQEKLNTMLQISTVEDQIVIFIKNQKIVGSIRGINNKKKYIKNLEEYDLIKKVKSYIININIEGFNTLLSSPENNVILIGKDECKYCEEVKNTLSDISINYNIKIYYINISEFDSEISTEIKEQLKDLEYKDGFTTPLTLIISNNKLIDYVIGASNDKYFVDIFTQNGIIK